MPKTVFVVSICVIPGLYGITGIFEKEEDAKELVKNHGGMIQEIPFNVELPACYPIDP